MIHELETPSNPAQSELVSLREHWPSMSHDERMAKFAKLNMSEADDFFLSLKPRDQSEILLAVAPAEKRLLLLPMPPDDLADVLQEMEPSERIDIFQHLDIPSRKEVFALLAYKEDEAGGLMNPRFARLRPDMNTEEALRYVRGQAPRLETSHYLYVLNSQQILLGVVSLRTLFMANSDALVKDIMRTHLVTASETMSQEDIKALFAGSALIAIPVVDKNGMMKGIITVDDIVDVVEEEATEDIQRLGGTEVLDAPYMEIALPTMIRKRAGWLVILFLGEMLTATAMGYFEHEIAKAIVLALFIPLIISSGGNAGSQASTLVVRALALKEVRLRDWWRIFSRELIVGFSLGAILGSIGLIRILLWPNRESLYGEHYFLVGLTVSFSLVGIVLWGSLAGSMLPFILKKLKLDPATASAPFVATLVDVSGLIIYFTVASFILSGTLL